MLLVPLRPRYVRQFGGALRPVAPRAHAEPREGVLGRHANHGGHVPIREADEDTFQEEEAGGFVVLAAAVSELVNRIGQQPARASVPLLRVPPAKRGRPG